MKILTDEPDDLPAPVAEAVAAEEPAGGRLARTLTLAWAGALPVGGTGLLWYAAYRCFVC